jgi:fluoride ion exporter CrcB/FEX
MVACLAPIGCICRIALSKIEVLLIEHDHSETLRALGSGYFFANVAGCIIMSLVLKYRGSIMKFDTGIRVLFEQNFILLFYFVISSFFFCFLSFLFAHK